MAFNSRQYEWADISVIVGGRDITGLRAVSYKRAIEREAIFAKGRKAHSIQSGNESIEGSISVLQSELIALQDAGGGSILNLNIDVLVNYGNPPSAMRADRIIGVRFTEENLDWTQGDKMTEISIPFIAVDLETNI